MAIGELVTRLTCDSSNFDNNIRRSQREVQEFRRRTEQSAARINNTFNGLTSVTGRVGSNIGNLASSIGRLGPVVAVVGGAVKGLSEVVKRNEDLMDSWEKKVTQAKGVLESFYTRLSQPDGFYRFNQNLKETIKLLGDYANAQDNIGTFKGFSNVSNNKVNAAIAAFKETKRNPESTPEQIAAAEKVAKDAIEEADKVTKVVLQSYKDAFKAKVGIIFKGGVGNNAISDKEAFGVISRFSTNIDTYNDVKNAARLLKDKSEKELLYSPYFKRLLKGLGIKREGLFNPATFKFNIGTIDNLRDFIVNLSKLVEQGNLTELQDIVANISNQEYLLSTQKNAYYKQLEDNSIGGGGGVYTSKQEAPKERTLQDILDDLDKSLAWNKYLAQNLGEDVTGLNSSSLEGAINELKDLLKNSEDEEQRAEIVRVIKSIENRAGLIVNNTKQPNNNNNNNNNNNDITKAYDLKSAFYDYRALDSEEKVLKKNYEINYGEDGKPLLRSMIEEFKERGLTINFDVNSVSDEVLLKASKWNAENFFKANGSYSIDTSVKREGMSEEEKLKELNMELDKFKKALESVIALAQSSYITRRGMKNPPSESVSFLPPNLSYLDIKLRENIPGGGVYSSIFGGSGFNNVLSDMYLSNIDTIRRKYTGFGDFYTSFRRYAVLNYLKERQDNEKFDIPDISRLIYDAYNKALADNPDIPRFYKSEEDIQNSNPIYNEEHPHSKLKEKVNKIINNKNISLLALEDLKRINELYTKANVSGSGVASSNSSKLSSKLLGLFDKSTLSTYFNDAGIADVYKREEYLDKMLGSLNSLRAEKIEKFSKFTFESEVDQKTLLLGNLKKIQEALILLIKEKEKTITEEELKRLDKLRNDSEIGDEIKGYEKQSVEFINDTIAEKGNKIQEISFSLENFNKEKEKLEDEINNIDKAINNTNEVKEDNNNLIDRAKQYKEISNNMYEISNAAAQVGSAFSSLDNKFGDIAGSIFNIIGITAEAIGKILGMATAEGTLSAMKLPWPKNLAAIATVVAAGASVAGQVKNMASRKYATGGIVSGPGTSISDSIPIRVSNGEMILNHRQQSNLFNLLDKGGSKSKLSSGEVEFRISGSNLVGVLRNYNNANNKIR